MRYLVFAILFVVVAIGAIGYRALQVAHYPFGVGSCKKAPNGSYEAHAANVTDVTFWGRESEYYEFAIVDTRTGRTIISHRIPYAPGASATDFYANGVIQWDASSSKVVFGDSDRTVWGTSVP